MNQKTQKAIDGFAAELMKSDLECVNYQAVQTAVEKIIAHQERNGMLIGSFSEFIDKHNGYNLRECGLRYIYAEKYIPFTVELRYEYGFKTFVLHVRERSGSEFMYSVKQEEAMATFVYWCTLKDSSKFLEALCALRVVSKVENPITCSVGFISGKPS